MAEDPTCISPFPEPAAAQRRVPPLVHGRVVVAPWEAEAAAVVVDGAALRTVWVWRSSDLSVTPVACSGAVEPRRDFAACVVGSTLLLVGGLSDARPAPLAVLDLSPGGFVWEGGVAGEDAPSGRRGHVAVSLGSVMAVHGGVTLDAADCEAAGDAGFDGVFRYDPSARR